MITLGRPLEFDPDKAVDAAVEVFWCKGYEATSMTDLLSAMDLSKSSLYQTFGSKQQLFARCLNRYVDWLAANMAEELAQAASGYGFITGLLASLADTAQEPEGAKGCLMVNSVIEFGQKEPAIARLLDDNLQLVTNLFVQVVQRAQAEGDISPDADPQTIANYLHVAVSGLRTLIKAGADKRAAHDTVRLILRAVA